MASLWVVLALLSFFVTGALSMPLQKGMELRYEGETVEQFTYEPKTGFSFSRRVTLLVEVLHLDRKQGAEIVQLTFLETEGRDETIRHSDVRFGRVDANGKVSHLSGRSVTFPYIFVATDRLKEGMKWGGEEVLVIGFFSAPLKGKVVYQVLKRSSVDKVDCWLISRHLVKPITLNDDGWEIAVPLWTDWIWVDAQTGLVRRLKRRWKYYVLRIPGEKVEGRFRTLVTDISLKRVEVLTPERQQRLRNELDKIRSVMNALEGKSERLMESEEDLRRAERMLTETISELRTSPYADFYLPHLKDWLDSVRFWQKRLEAKKIVGQPTPDFELTTADGKAKVKLSDLRGKVVLLNFFAHW